MEKEKIILFNRSKLIMFGAYFILTWQKVLDAFKTFSLTYNNFRFTNGYIRTIKVKIISENHTFYKILCLWNYWNVPYTLHNYLYFIHSLPIFLFIIDMHSEKLLWNDTFCYQISWFIRKMEIGYKLEMRFTSS